MVNSVDVNLIRRLCDKAGFSTRVSDNGNYVYMFLKADDSFGHDVTFTFKPLNNGERFEILGYGGVRVSKDKLAEALMRINKYHNNFAGIKAYIDEDMDVMTEYTVWVEAGVSEEFLEKNIKRTLALVWNFFKGNFSDYVK